MEKFKLTGQGVIAGKAYEEGLDRLSYYMKYGPNNSTYNQQSNTNLKEKFKIYRDNWNNQPKMWDEEIKSGIYDNDRHLPLSLDLELAAICDLACAYCYRQTYVTPDKTMPTKMAKELIHEAAELGVASLKLNWRGEPLLHKNLCEIIKYAKSQGILDVIINTNATQLNNAYAEKLLDSGIDYVIFSFDGGTKETYEKNRISRFKDNKFEDVCGNIKNFCDLKKKKGLAFPYTRVQMVLTPDAFNEQQQFKQIFEDYVDEVCVNNYDERGQGVEQLNQNERGEYISKIKKHGLSEETIYLKQYDGEILISKSRLTCQQPFQRMLITYDGRVSMCCFDWGSMYTIGYVSEKSFQDPDYDKYRVKQLAENSEKGFELLKNIQLPPKLNQPIKKRSSLREIWYGKEMMKVREAHAKGNQNDINICKKCTYRGSHEWV